MFSIVVSTSLLWQLGGLGEAPGFASPPRDGFAFVYEAVWLIIVKQSRKLCSPKGLILLTREAQATSATSGEAIVHSIRTPSAALSTFERIRSAAFVACS